MSAKISAAAVVFFAAAPLAAQAPASAYIVTRLGVDTVAIERYTRSKDKLEGDLVVRYPRVRTYHYVADLGSRGEIKSITTTIRRPGTDPNVPPAMQLVERFVTRLQCWTCSAMEKLIPPRVAERFFGVAPPRCSV